MEHYQDVFKGARDFNLYYQGWLPEGEIRAVLLIAHGVAEHCGRYQGLADYFTSRGYAVYGFDYRGHGRSPGKRGYVEHFSYFLNDLQAFYATVQRLHPDEPLILFGHSMGAALGLALAGNHPNKLAGIILSGIPFRVRPYVPAALVNLLRPLAFFLPRLGLYKLNSAYISRDKTVVEAYDNDPQVYRGKLSARLAIGLVRMLHKLERQLPEIQLPALILHGIADKLSAPEGARILYERIGAGHKLLKLYPGLYHEILNEPEHRQVLSDIGDWLHHLV
jgi:acylglycerol lipase